MSSDSGGTATRAAPALLLLPALWVVHAGLGTGRYLGLPWGEQWGRLFVTGQVGRWLHGTPIGWGDLLNAPSGRPFWPVDPVLQAVAVPLTALVSEPTAWALEIANLSLLAGLGGYAVARAAGAGVYGALAVGLLIQLDPFWLRNGAEGVTEALALGPPALAVAAGAFAVTSRKTSAWVAYGLAVALTAGTSPYFAVYGVLALLLTSPLWTRERRADVARLLAVAIAAGLVVALPIAWTESGPGGRVSTAWSGGYQLLPEPLVRFTATGLAKVPPPRVANGGDVGRAAQSRILQVLVQWPGGFAATIGLVLGCLPTSSGTTSSGTSRWTSSWPWTRRASAFGLLFLLLGPAWPGVSPLQHALLALPATSLLGNGNRLIVVPIVLGAVGAAAWVGGRPVRAGIVAVLALLAAVLEVPPLSLPAVDAHVPTELLAAVDGPTVTFPSGDPPAWNPDAWPKEGLWLAAHSGGAQAYDYGRGGIPADAPALVALSRAGGVPIGERAATSMAEDDVRTWTDLRQAGFRDVLVLRHALDDGQYASIRRYLVDRAGEPLVETADGAVWRLPGVK